MPTMYIRDVPSGLYKRLRVRAKRNGRSLNAEVLGLLDEAVKRDQRGAEITQRLAKLVREASLPASAPRPEDLIRELRDAGPRGL
jgi:plasmid stability protein